MDARMTAHGLSDDARSLLDVIHGIKSDSQTAGAVIHTTQLDDALGRPPGNWRTRHALNELDEIGDLDNTTRSGPARGLTSFTIS